MTGSSESMGCDLVPTYMYYVAMGTVQAKAVLGKPDNPFGR
jgi:hypothetical protein